MIEKAHEYKEEGNFHFKNKDYKKAIGKYSRVELYIKPLAGQDEDTSGGDPTMAMVNGMSQYKLSKEQKKELHVL